MAKDLAPVFADWLVPRVEPGLQIRVDWRALRAKGSQFLGDLLLGSEGGMMGVGIVIYCKQVRLPVSA
jgi:hypothetical protein